MATAALSGVVTVREAADLGLRSEIPGHDVFQRLWEEAAYFGELGAASGQAFENGGTRAVAALWWRRLPLLLFRGWHARAFTPELLPTYSGGRIRESRIAVNICCLTPNAAQSAVQSSERSPVQMGVGCASAAFRIRMM